MMGAPLPEKWNPENEPARVGAGSVTLVEGSSFFIWGMVWFHNLPIEAYPDVADTDVQIISQWPGHAAEEVEQQITVPLDVELNGVPHLTQLRSLSLAGLSISGGRVDLP